MTHPTFLDPSVGPLAPGDEYTLSGAEARHATQVRRIRVGERIDIVNGRGLRVGGDVTETGKQHLLLSVTEASQEDPPPVRLTLVQALGKGGRDEAAIEAATEVGVDGIIAWESDRSVSQWRGEKATKGVARWEAIIASAMKQSRRAFLPPVLGFAKGAGLLDLIPEGAHVLVLHESAETPLSGVDLPESGDVVIVVGPEGGLTPGEVDLLIHGPGARAVLLGPEVVRTSTAGPAGLAVLNARLGRW